MSVVALIWGILAFVGLLFGLLPCLGWMNWMNVPFAGLGLVFAAIVWSRESRPGGAPGMAVAGFLLSAVAVAFGLFRLWLGGGVF